MKKRQASTRERVTAYLIQHPHSTSRQIADGLDVDKSSVRFYLREHKDAGTLGQRCRRLPGATWVGYTREYHLREPLGVGTNRGEMMTAEPTEREPDIGDIDAYLTLRSVHGVLFRGIVSAIVSTGAWHLVSEVGLRGGWEQLKPSELRLVRGATVVKDKPYKQGETNENQS